MGFPEIEAKDFIFIGGRCLRGWQTDRTGLQSSNRNILRFNFTLTASNGMSVSVRQAPTGNSDSLFYRATNPMDDFRFHCAICGNSLQITSLFAEGVMECPKCLRVVPIPGPLNFPHETVNSLPVLPPGILAVDLKILCEKCKTKIRLDARLEGYEIRCPNCASEFRVPVWSRPAAAARARDSALSAEEIDFLSGSAELVGGRDRAI